MKLHEAIRQRRSIRSFIDKTIPKEVLTRVLNAGRLAPSAVNLQPWRFIVIREPVTKMELVECTRGGKHTHLGMGDVILVACGNEKECYQRQGNYMKTFAIDVAIALEQMILAATAEGLGTCWIGAFDEEKVKTLLDIPDPWRVVAMTPLGYPDESPPDRGRKSLDEIVCYERWEAY
ncbi:MAG: nitroreductase [Deltaproteobacteria bacterium]|nr:nitroreductase [Deltaproteobacteria bacterium]